MMVYTFGKDPLKKQLDPRRILIPETYTSILGETTALKTYMF